MAEILQIGVVIKADETNPDLGDMLLSVSGDAVVHTDLGKAVAQQLMVRLNFYRGEWFMDTDEGTPWFQFILIKGPTDRNIRNMFTQVIMGTPGVDELTQFGYSIDKSQRVLSVTFTCRLKDGSTFRSSDYGRFVVEL